MSKLPLVLALGSFCCGGLILAQGDKPSKKEQREEAALRSVQGTVTAADDSPASGAVVQLKDMRTLQIRSFIAQDGAYHFTGLKIDNDYQLKADFNGMTSGWKTLSVFDTRKVAIINLKLDKK
jgi:carboxypeptidase family protein